MTREGMERMEVEMKVDSDYQPVTIWVKGRNGRQKRGGRLEKGRKRRGIWNEERRKEFVKCFGEEEQREGMEEEWEQM
ncbi:hypothetical protein X777_00014, partial [Ooceraea biroi]